MTKCELCGEPIISIRKTTSLNTYNDVETIFDMSVIHRMYKKQMIWASRHPNKKMPEYWCTKKEVLRAKRFLKYYNYKLEELEKEKEKLSEEMR